MKTLEEQIKDLEKRITLLESQRPIVNVYPGYQIQPVPMPQPQFPPITGPWCENTTNITDGMAGTMPLNA